jgi:hypothetical protein
MAYTYLITCLKNNQHYYGVSFKANTKPEDLWTTYFTSSKQVKKLIKEFGVDSFKVEVRKIFNDVNKARLWEHKVLRRLKVAKRSDFINRTDNISINSKGFVWWTDGNKNTRALNSPGDEWYRGNTFKGRKKSKDSVKKMMETRLKKFGSYATNKGIPHSRETKEKISQSKIGIKLGPQTQDHVEKRKMIGSNNPMFGKHLSQEHKQKLLDYAKKPKTLEHKKNISNSLKKYYASI